MTWLPRAKCNNSWKFVSCASEAGLTPSVTLDEIGADIGLLFDGIVVAIDAVGDERVACDHHIPVELHRVQANHRGLLAVVPSERGRTLRLFACPDRLGEHVTFYEGLHGANLDCHFPVDVEGRA